MPLKHRWHFFIFTRIHKTCPCGALHTRLRGYDECVSAWGLMRGHDDERGRKGGDGISFLMTLIEKFGIIVVCKKWREKMFDRWMNVLSKNLGYTIVFVVAVVFFVYFSDGLIPGLIAAVSAVLAYTCGSMLYREYKNTVPAKVVKAKPQTKRKKK